MSNLDVGQVAEDLFNESDRGCILVAASLIDDLLGVALRAHFRHDAGGVDRVFEGNGFLATFSNKIELAYLLELIDKGQRDGLNTLRKIRNHSAHMFEKIIFDSDQMRTFVELGNRSVGSDDMSPRLWVALGIDETPRARFIDSVISYVALMKTIADQTSKRVFDQGRYLQQEAKSFREEKVKLERLLDNDAKNRGG